ncbi:MAG: hypothetical protein ABI813_04625 [Bacteroidota bacterium]
MNNQEQGLVVVQDIKRIMERSSRFISLSGWSGIAAGICALVGAYTARHFIDGYQAGDTNGNGLLFLERVLLLVAGATFIAAFVLAFIFTYVRSRREGVPVWGTSAKRLMLNTAVPLLAGAMVVYRMLQLHEYGLIAPSSLIFYGLALVNGSKYTLGEVRYLGYCQVILGIIGLWMPGNGLFFWALGFGVLHIFYGVVMWWKYERRANR